MVVPPPIAAPCTATTIGLSKLISASIKRACGLSPAPGGFLRKSWISYAVFCLKKKNIRSFSETMHNPENYPIHLRFHHNMQRLLMLVAFTDHYIPSFSP